MKKVSKIRGINVYFSNEVVFGEFYNDHIVVGSLFNKLSKATQGYILNALVLGVKAVNTQTIEGNKMNSKLDQYMLKNSYSINELLSHIKVLHNTLRNSSLATDHSSEMIQLSERYIELHRILNRAA